MVMAAEAGGASAWTHQNKSKQISGGGGEDEKRRRFHYESKQSTKKKKEKKKHDAFATLAPSGRILLNCVEKSSLGRRRFRRYRLDLRSKRE